MRKTRKQKAARLMELIERGPVLSDIGMSKYTPEEAMAATRRWLSSWVEPLVKDLVPELREKK